MISGSEWRAFDRNSLRWALVLPQLGNSKPTFCVYDYNSCDTCAIHLHTHTNIRLHFFESLCSFCCCLWHLVSHLQLSRFLDSLPYPLPPHHTGSTERPFTHTSFQVRYGPSFPRFKISGRHQNSLLQIVLPKLQHSKLFFFFHPRFIRHIIPTEIKTVERLRHHYCAIAARKRKKRKAFFSLLPPK